jgi:uncharacterized membrane protein YoaK (UPF0700 family)
LSRTNLWGHLQKKAQEEAAAAALCPLAAGQKKAEEEAAAAAAAREKAQEETDAAKKPIFEEMEIKSSVSDAEPKKEEDQVQPCRRESHAAATEHQPPVLPQQIPIFNAKEEDPAAPLLSAKEEEEAPVPQQIQPPALQQQAIALPSDLKGWNYVFFVFTISFLLGNAGFINAVGLRATGSTTSHYTGMTTRLGIEIAIQDQLHATVDGVNIIIFCLGVGVSTISLGPDKFCFSYAMAVLFLLQGIVLIIAATLPQDEWEKKDHSVVEAFRLKEPFVVVRFLLGFSCGLQNGISCSWAGSIARTTHCTGILADIVIILFSIPYRYSYPDMQRLAFFVPFYFSFFVGGIIGSLAFFQVGPICVLVPAIVALCCSVLVMIFLLVKRRARCYACMEGRPFVDYQMPFANKPIFPDKLSGIESNITCSAQKGRDDASSAGGLNLSESEGKMK